MIRLYTAPAPNGRKASIALEELGLAYETTWVKFAEGQQNTPEFTKMNPNNKIPVLPVAEGRSLASPQRLARGDST